MRLRFAPSQGTASRTGDVAEMAAVLFTCPNTRFQVQQELPDDDQADENDFEGIICQGCTRIHFVNRTGKVLGGEHESRAPPASRGADIRPTMGDKPRGGA